MEQLEKEVKELEVIAASCGLDGSDAIDDIVDAGEITKKLVQATPKVFGDNFQDFLADLGSGWAKWWIIFLPQYTLKCAKRWIDKCGNSRDTQSMAKLWLESFEPLWLVGCNIAIKFRVKDVSKVTNMLVSAYSKDLSDTEVAEIKAWFSNFEKAAVQAVYEFKEKQRQAITQTLQELEEYDEASLVGKLKRLLSV